MSVTATGVSLDKGSQQPNSDPIRLDVHSAIPTAGDIKVLKEEQSKSKTGSDSEKIKAHHLEKSLELNYRIFKALLTKLQTDASAYQAHSSAADAPVTTNSTAAVPASVPVSEGSSKEATETTATSMTSALKALATFFKAAKEQGAPRKVIHARGEQERLDLFLLKAPRLNIVINFIRAFEHVIQSSDAPEHHNILDAKEGSLAQLYHYLTDRLNGVSEYSPPSSEKIAEFMYNYLKDSAKGSEVEKEFVLKNIIFQDELTPEQAAKQIKELIAKRLEELESESKGYTLGLFSKATDLFHMTAYSQKKLCTAVAIKALDALKNPSKEDLERILTEYGNANLKIHFPPARTEECIIKCWIVLCRVKPKAVNEIFPGYAFKKPVSNINQASQAAKPAPTNMALGMLASRENRKLGNQKNTIGNAAMGRTASVTASATATSNATAAITLVSAMPQPGQSVAPSSLLLSQSAKEASADVINRKRKGDDDRSSEFSLTSASSSSQSDAAEQAAPKKLKS